MGLWKDELMANDGNPDGNRRRPKPDILAIGNQQVDNVAGFSAAVGKLPPNRASSLLFQRGEFAQFTMIRPAAR